MATTARARRLAAADEPSATPAARSQFNLSSGAATAVMFVSIVLCFILLCTYCRCARQRAIAGARSRLMRDLGDRVFLAPAGSAVALPVVAYATVKMKGRPEADCPVCLETFVAGDGVKVVPECDHVFHAPCLDRWLDESNSCPICRRAVVLFYADVRAGDAAVVGGDDQEVVLQRVVAMIEAIREEEAAAAAARRAPASDGG